MTLATQPAVLIIAGADSSGGAGLTRDVRVLADFNVEPLCAVTAVTAQSNARVAAVHHVPPEVIRAQILSAFQTRPIGAVKIGMLGTKQTVDAVAESLPPDIPLVLDPVLVASSGGVLLDQEGCRALRGRLLPRATLVTPNIPEMAALLDEPGAVEQSDLIGQGQRLLDWGAKAILIKGGHAGGEEAVDLLLWHESAQIGSGAPSESVHNGPAQAGSGAPSKPVSDAAARITSGAPTEPVRDAPAQTRVVRLASRRLRVAQRGTGCALASAIAAGLASGLPLESACARAKEYLTQWLTRTAHS